MERVNLEEGGWCGGADGSNTTLIQKEVSELTLEAFAFVCASDCRGKNPPFYLDCVRELETADLRQYCRCFKLKQPAYEHKDVAACCRPSTMPYKLFALLPASYSQLIMHLRWLLLLLPSSCT
ncbi:hypothetical protein MRB53_020834 [Persea americana]|uniref:Uncharacterized protein n=1 Tax=Persea americana TaxID=3435 RepID=A0ACC2L370_PERAE|nr:hypothetical protein MRB53_020834 [Persea americana]